jgi:hypothetical protein
MHLVFLFTPIILTSFLNILLLSPIPHWQNFPRIFFTAKIFAFFLNGILFIWGCVVYLGFLRQGSDDLFKVDLAVATVLVPCFSILSLAEKKDRVTLLIIALLVGFVFNYINPQSGH